MTMIGQPYIWISGPIRNLNKIADGLFTADARGRAKFASGFVNDALVSDVAASKITGVLADAQIPNIETLSYGGPFAAAQIPSLDASKIATGIFGIPRGGTGLSTIAAGGILYASALDTLSRMAPTAANQVLRSTGANALQIASLVAADIPSLLRSKITDFWGSPFWGNIPDKPSTFPPSSHSEHPSISIGGTEVITSARYLQNIALVNQTLPMASGAKIAFYNEVADKILLYSTTYGIGISSSELAQWTGRLFRVHQNSRTGTILWGFDYGTMSHGTVPAARLKTTIGSTSYAVPNRNLWHVVYHDYAFMVNAISNSVGWMSYDCFYAANNPGYIHAFGIWNDSGAARSCWVYWRYVQSSGPPEIWLTLDKDGRILCVWEAEDPPPESPPVYCETFETYIKIKPEPDDFYKLREESEGLLSDVIRECAILEKGKLKLGSYSFDEVQRLTKGEVDRIREDRAAEALRRREKVLARFRRER